MLNNEKLIHRLTLEQKIGLIVSNKEYTREQVGDYEFPVFSLFEKPNELLNGEKTVIFPSREAIAKTWNNELIKKVYTVLGNENDRLSDELFFRTNASISTNFIDDPYLLGNFISSETEGLSKSNSIPVIEKISSSNNYELSMLPSDIAIKNSEIKYILLNDADEIKYYQEIDEYKNEFLGSTSYKEMVSKFISYGITMIFYKGDYEELLAYLCDAVNNYNVKLQQYRDGEIDLAQFNALIDEGKIISLETIDKACDHIIDLFIKVKDFRNKEKNNQFLTNETFANDLEKYEELALQASRESIVLLKNDNNALPIKYNQKVALIGEGFENLDSLRNSLYTTPTNLDNGYSLIDKYEEISYTGYAHGYIFDGDIDAELVNKSVALANDSEKVVLYLQVAKDEDRLRPNQLNLLDEVSKTEKKIIVVLLTDHYIELDFLDKCDSVLYCDNLGQYTHEAILDILTGRFDTTGRLTSEYPVLLSDTSIDDDDIPSYCTEKPTLYPFGYGLSLATFEFSNITCNESEVCFNVKNTSDIDGYVVPQLYISKDDSVHSLSSKLLKGYTRLEIQANEVVKLRIPFDEETFRTYDEVNNTYGCEGGDYNIYIGLNSEDVQLSGVLKLVPFKDRKHENEQKLIQEELDKAGMLEYMKEQKHKTLSKKAKQIINSIFALYFLVAAILLINMGDSSDTTLYIIIGAIVLIEIFILIRAIKISRTKEDKPTTTDASLTLTKMIDNVQCFNPVVTYKYDEESPENNKEVKNEELEETVNSEEQTIEESNDESEESSEDLLEEVETEEREEVAENVYDEDASLSLEEIEKFEEEEMKILEDQEISRLNEFEEIVDDEIEFDNKVSVSQAISNFSKFAKANGLVIELNSVRSLFGALAASKMVFLTTNNDEQLDLLLDIINRYFGNKTTITTANDNWASLFSISWTKDENGQYIKTPFITDMYKASLLKNNFNLSIVKDVDLDNFELYFKRCIDFANNPTRNISLEISKQIKVYIPHNMHFIIVPKDRSYIKNINENIADASTFIDIIIQDVVEPTEMDEEVSYISDSYFNQLIHNALKDNYLSEQSWKKIDEFIEEINKREEIEIPNKSVLQIERYSSIYKDAGGEEVDLIDRVLAHKVIPLIKSLELTRTEEGYKYTKELLERIFDAESTKLSSSVLASRDTIIG